MRSIFTLLLLLSSTIASTAESYRELFVEPGATDASNINGGSSRDRKFRRTNGNWNPSTRVFTATGDTLDTAWVGELACVIADGGTTGAYFAEVTAIDNTAKTITLSSTKTVGTAPSASATARTITIGGAWTGMSGATTFPFSITTWHSLVSGAGNRVRINLCGSFSVTANVSHSSLNVPLRGYETTPGDGGFASIEYTGSGNTSTLTLTGAGYVSQVESLWLKNASTNATPTSSHGLNFNPTSGQGYLLAIKCRFGPTKGSGVSLSGGTYDPSAVFEGCEFYENGTSSTNGTFGGINTGSLNAGLSIRRCVFHDITATNVDGAIVANMPVDIRECVFDNCTIGVAALKGRAIISNSVFYGCTTAINSTTASGADYATLVSECVFENNTTCIERSASSALLCGTLSNCVFYNNAAKLGTNATSGGTNEINNIDATRPTMVDPATGDFRLRESIYRGMINATPPQSSSFYSKQMRIRRSPGIEPSNPFYRIAP